MIVRAGVVIGMPRCVVVSCGPRVRLRWILSPASRRRLASTVTWIAPLVSGRRSHAAAALAWLSTPAVASVAAIQRPSILRTVWPTTYTPR
jgi:hypothetical protein